MLMLTLTLTDQADVERLWLCCVVGALMMIILDRSIEPTICRLTLWYLRLQSTTLYFEVRHVRPGLRRTMVPDVVMSL
jgi:hypothetical protein